MAYDIIKSNGSTLVVLEDGFTDDSTSLTLVGKNVVGYGNTQNTNFVRLLENFANTDAPSGPLEGQIWYDTTAGVLKSKVYDGSNWKTLSVLDYTSSVPGNRTEGDLWWDSVNTTLKILTDVGYVSIGPFGSVESAAKLANPVRINNVSFDGTGDITITSATPNELIKGQYLTGSNFNGSTEVTFSVDVGSVINPDPSKVVARDSAGDIWYSVGHGVSTQARYADLAEKYLADRDYEVGTVMSVGGEREVTASSHGDRAIGVISANPGYMMNSDLEGGTYVALKGRVPVKITGPVNKKQGLVADNNGRAVADDFSNKVFAIALEDSDGSKDTIEAIIL